MPRPTLLGVPWDASSSFARGSADAPPLIRKALHCPSTNAFNERGDDITAPGVLGDAGDLSLGTDGAEARLAIEHAVSDLVARGSTPLVLGGDHSITYPVLRGFKDRHKGLTIVHVDAHADLYDAFEGDRYSHACPFARIMEEGLAARLIQVGVRTLTPEHRQQAARYGVEIYGMDRWLQAPVDTIRDDVYVSLDLDGLDPAFAPGVSHPEPGGLSVREVLQLLSRLGGRIAGADIVEYNPRNDTRDLTARVAAKFVKELAGLMLAV